VKTKTFTGKDERDLAIQIQDWKSFNPHIVVKKQHPIEKLDLTVPPVQKYAPLTRRDTVSVRVEYEESSSRFEFEI
jgi:hypothetical protein